MKQKCTLVESFWKKNKLTFVIAFISSLLLSSVSLYVSYILQVVTDIAAGSTSKHSLGEVALQVGVVVVGMILVGIVRGRTLYSFKERAVRQYKEAVFNKIIRKGIGAFKKEHSSNYISGMTNDVAIIEENYIENIFNIGSQIIMFCGSIVIMLLYSPFLTLIAIAFAFVPVIVSVFTGRKLPVLEQQVSKKNGEFVSLTDEILSGFSVVKCFKAEEKILDIVQKNNNSLEKSKKCRNIIKFLSGLIGSVAGAISQIGVFITGAWMCLTDRGISPGMLFMFTNLMNFIIGPIGQLPVLLAGRKAALSLIEKMEVALNNTNVEDKEFAECNHKESIKVNSLSFSYDDEKNVLDGFTYEFKKGKSYAIVGPSGCGKSTLIQLLLAGMDNYEGEISYDNVNLNRISPDALYEVVSTIQQNVFVFNSSIRDNITMFREFDKKQVDKVIEMSGLEELVRTKGEDYLCGEDGSDLSGGEKQRISIARALLRNSQILLVDEATAALDAKTSNHVLNSILNLSGITRIVVTHDLDRNTLEKYDSILTMKDGKVVEEGTFDTLMNKKGYFYSLFTISQ